MLCNPVTFNVGHSKQPCSLATVEARCGARTFDRNRAHGSCQARKNSFAIAGIELPPYFIFLDKYILYAVYKETWSLYLKSLRSRTAARY